MFSSDETRYGLLIDIGSGSVGFAVVESTNSDTEPVVIWQHREHIKLKHIDALGESSKALMSTLTDVSLSVSTECIQALHEYAESSRAKISDIQVTVSAPWSFNVSRIVTYEQEQTFQITNTLVSDLANAAGDEAMRKFLEANPTTLKEVTETSRCVLDIFANGYRIPDIRKQKTTRISLAHTTTLIYQELFSALQEVQEKLFTSSPLKVTSSMLSYYYATRQLQPHVYDVCLLDITDEATEIGIVRDGSLKYCTHMPFGRISIAREIAQANNKPLAEVTSRLGEIIEQKQTKDVTGVMNQYETKLTTLFKKTGDALTIPQTVYILAESSVQSALTPHIKHAGSMASKTAVTTHAATDFISLSQPDVDLALLMAARFFHTSRNRTLFEYV